MITTTSNNIHWNYYLALENDLDKVSRYIEFHPNNFETFSIELGHILLSASSEVDVILKQICELIKPESNCNNINKYKEIIVRDLNELIDEKIFVNRFGLEFQPWENWVENENPNWWRSYNNVKHQRNHFYHEANLQNTLNAVGALLIVTVYLYQLEFSKEREKKLSLTKTTEKLKPSSNLLRLKDKYYQYPTYIY
mgnify:CR=1 FL=1